MMETNMNLTFPSARTEQRGCYAERRQSNRLRSLADCRSNPGLLEQVAGPAGFCNFYHGDSGLHGGCDVDFSRSWGKKGRRKES